jgi:Uma2 family endonuclease
MLSLMNEQLRRESLRPDALPLTTRAAEGLPRRRFTVAEIEALTDTGFFLEDDRFELIGGEIVPMSPKGIMHETVKVALSRVLMRALPDAVRIAGETTFRLSVDTFVEPDFVIYRTEDGLVGLKPSTCLLAIEVADSSLAYDLGRKAALYASFGVGEVWVIAAATRETHIMSGPGPNGYAGTHIVPAHEPLRFAFAPGIQFALSNLPAV